MKKFILINLTLVMSVFISGCQKGVTFSRHEVGNGHIVTLSYPADKRASTIMYRPDKTNTNAYNLVKKKFDEIDQMNPEDSNYDKNVSKLLKEIGTINAMTSIPYIIAEPPVQANNNFSFNVKGKAGELDIADLNANSTVTKLFEVSEKNLIIRDALYRLNEAFFTNEKISEKEYIGLFKTILDTVNSINANKAKATGNTNTPANQDK